MSKHLVTKCLMILIYLQHVRSFHLYPNDMKEDALLLITNGKHMNQEDPSYENVNVKIIKKILDNTNSRGDEVENQLNKPILVKTVIPHGYKTSKFELYPKLKSFYRPLFRYHVKKPLFSVGSDTSHVKKPVKKPRNGYLVIIFKKPKKAVNEDRYKPSNKDSWVSLSEEDDKFLRMFEASHEASDPLAPPGTSLHPNYSKNHYPFWYYWPMERPFHVDECETGQVKVGNMCISRYNK